MINNEALLDTFMSNRRRGYRSAWRTPVWASVSIPVRQVAEHYVSTLQGIPEPSERITETDIAVPGSNLVQCPECDLVDYAAVLYEGLCATCSWEREREWHETMAVLGG